MPIGRFFTFLFNFFARLHFGQHGEDVLVHKLFDRRLTKGFYMDIGAYHPFRQSNTAYFWLMGWNGVNVDASPRSIRIFKKIRKTDRNVWSAIVDAQTAAREKTISLYFNPNVDFDLSATCAPDEVARRKDWQTEKVEVPCDSLANIVNKYAPSNNADFHFMNIDIEGFDESALQGMNGWKSKPQVLCVEVLHAVTIRDILDTATNSILEGNGYQMVGKTAASIVYKLSSN
jgi:FkbM family methyltransferase